MCKAHCIATSLHLHPEVPAEHHPALCPQHLTSQMPALHFQRQKMPPLPLRHPCHHHLSMLGRPPTELNGYCPENCQGDPDLVNYKVSTMLFKKI